MTTQYSLAEHLGEKAQIQALLDALLRLVDKNEWPRDVYDALWTAETTDGRTIEIEYADTINGIPELGWFALAIGMTADSYEYIAMQYDNGTRIVQDSAKFDKKGKYKGKGHVQCWWNDRRTIKAINEAHATLHLITGQWKIIPFAERQLLRAGPPD